MRINQPGVFSLCCFLQVGRVDGYDPPESDPAPGWRSSQYSDPAMGFLQPPTRKGKAVPSFANAIIIILIFTIFLLLSFIDQVLSTSLMI